ncbi:cupin domain-containing protein [Winogradskyella luteola]|uniref:Cupin domain-containing protein n=1 Tax=Winogradskyella luteola TaxID=2828330 RepID=A0A9X1F9I8_9FLAO|nr:cupin domain-containing protein [Winogradskyella luteola]MBV7269805.1 cupin domain-containing protein [Winogradskyella luteola]
MRTEFIYIILIHVLLFSLGCEKKNSLPDPLEAGWKGKAVCEVLEEKQNLRVLKCTFKPGVGHEKHYHNPHFGYTLSGGTFRITDTSGTREVDVPTGYSFSNDRVSTHEVLNIGETTAIFLIMEYK